VVEVDFRPLSMTHGKKNFKRVEYAFKNVLNHSLGWLFVESRSSTTPSTAQPSSEGTTTNPPIAKHHPFDEIGKPKISRLEHVSIPVFTPETGLEDPDYAAELLEWIGLANLRSSRICATDTMDPYLSRYTVPQLPNPDGLETGLQTRNVAVLQWRGLATAEFVMKLWIRVRRQVGKEFFSMSVSGFNDEGYSIVNQGREVLTWEWPAK
jgi:ribonucleases P/MRP protein subunit RPP40